MTSQRKARKSIATLERSLRSFWLRYRRNRIAVIGLVIIISEVIIAIFADFISPHNPILTRVGRPLVFPNAEFPMGTDDLGRDIMSGVIHGTRVSLFIGFSSAVISALIGIIIGATAGYYGGIFDSLLMRITDLFMTIPRIILTIVIVALWGSNIFNITFAIAILSWPGTARLCRGEFLRLRGLEFVEASKALGEKNSRIIFGEILPNALSPVVVNTTLMIASAILLEAGLSYLGLGDPNLASWGRMLYDAQYFLRSAFWMSLFPGLAIFITALSLNQIGDGLNDALNPRLREI